MLSQVIIEVQELEAIRDRRNMLESLDSKRTDRVTL